MPNGSLGPTSSADSPAFPPGNLGPPVTRESGTDKTHSPSLRVLQHELTLETKNRGRETVSKNASA